MFAGVEIVLYSWLTIICIMFVAWIIYLLIKNVGIIDVFWPISITTSGLIFSLQSGYNMWKLAIQTLLIIWCLRLALYLLISRIIPKHVDKRYVAISSNWQGKQTLKFLLNFQFQGILAIILSIPFLFINHITSSSMFIYIGAALVTIGVLGETIADMQLQKFKAVTKGGVCNVGLWRYSRHPNYFFEWLVWLGFAITAINTEWGIFALLSPILLIVVMLKLTGPITEKGSIESRGQAYLDYQEKTSMFFPLPPKEK